eukprot:scaffold165864_cov17-Tisochrysis_lutea.AAC.1
MGEEWSEALAFRHLPAKECGVCQPLCASNEICLSCAHACANSVPVCAAAVACKSSGITIAVLNNAFPAPHAPHWCATAGTSLVTVSFLFWTPSAAQLQTNFVSEKPSSYYAELYKADHLVGGHVIMLGADAAS